MGTNHFISWVRHGAGVAHGRLDDSWDLAKSFLHAAKATARKDGRFAFRQSFDQTRFDKGRQLTRVASGRHFRQWNKSQGRRADAITQVRRSRAVIENMAKMRIGRG